MSSLFLAPSELQELTGYKYAKSQKQWLKNRGWRFEEDAAGRPKVLRAHLESKMGGSTRRTAQTEPNFDALR